MKPQRVDLQGVTDVNELVERVVQTRLREARALSTGLARRDKQGLHDFRIACKRLRYALERFEDLEPSLQADAERLALLQDALGDAHDRDVLLAILPPAMASTERRLQKEREQQVDRAVSLWNELVETMQALDSHRI
jgi:CHAD domain-containing protein